jgi:protein-L-isoaspartate O-methyltransferase
MQVPPAVASSLRLQQSLSDAQFDQVYPREQRVRSWVHWTPLDVAYRVCALLDPTPTCRVLDVGAGVGKLCHVGALTTAASWIGIERDPAMVHVATRAAIALGVAERTTFLVGDANDVDWSTFDGIYLYNPFAEQLWVEAIEPETRRTAYTANIAATQQHLAAARAGTRVVTYHGFGGDMPASYELVHREPAHEDELQLWIQGA